MLDALRRPLSPASLVGWTVASALAVAAYCVAYTTLAGRPETLWTALCCAIANVCPWLLAIELAKRAGTSHQAAFCLGAALLGSLGLGYLLKVADAAVQFELVRRLPSLGLASLLVGALRSRIGQTPVVAAQDIPLLPKQIDWVRAAGNYVELRAGDRTLVHRSSIGAAEHALAGHGFVRIHRSMLVRRDRIARVRPEDVILHDGTHLRVGKRYRASLSA